MDDKKIYIKPQIETIVFASDDVIVTSLQNDGIGGEVGTDGDGELFGGN